MEECAVRLPRQPEIALGGTWEASRVKGLD